MKVITDQVTKYFNSRSKYFLFNHSVTTLYADYLKFGYINNFKEDEFLIGDQFAVKLEEYLAYILRKDAI